MDEYQKFIAKSRYAKWLEEQSRREEWSETVQRYTNFLEEDLAQMIDMPKDGFPFLEEISDKIEDLEVMPSMRAMMVAGKAASRDNTCMYNCSYVPVDDPKSFDEAMFILLCGTGVGFSVERQYIQKLPDVPDKLFNSDTTIVVSDSKEGWAKSFRQLLSLLWAGEIPKWDISRVRKAGARLKTFGGRASGPEPLVELFKFTIEIFKLAVGRKLTSLECHDIMCKVGEVVVVGGVRRSAMLSLSNLSDLRMRGAKAGKWYETELQRALANNSVAYTDKPDMLTFMKEWYSLVESESGERGIFNRIAAQKKAAENGRRDATYEYGTNPCAEIILRPYQFCNLTEVVVRSKDTLKTLLKKVELATILGTIQSTYTHFPYLRKIWQRNTEEERLLGVSMTGIMDNPNLWTPEILTKLKECAIRVNKEWAEKLGIPQSTAITCVKPSGTVSQLVNSSSGIHTRHAPYYIRRVRGDMKDPMTQFMVDRGIPMEEAVGSNGNTAVFSFAQKAPDGAITRHDITAKQQLETWLLFARYWCEHKPSVTITVSPDEWMEVGAFVYEHFDEMSGISFLPMAKHIYVQPPYEDCDKETYETLLATMPEEINWSELANYEVDDNTVAMQTMACSGDSCELVDIEAT